MSIRRRLQQALAGEPVEHPVYAVYDFFVKNRPVDWPLLFQLGLGRINHASLLEYHYPNVEIVETQSKQDGQVRRDIRWITDRGELHEWYLGEWRQEYLVKSLSDYRILAHALSDASFTLSDRAFIASEQELGEGGLTIGHFGFMPLENRNAFQSVQIDAAGLERFSIDLAMGAPELLELIELMNERTLQKFRCILASRAEHFKLWENLSIETMGPDVYRTHLLPMYRRIFELLEGSGKKLQVHYDGKLRVIGQEIRNLVFHGLDSLTGPPEGDLSAAEARALWPDTFFWLHPNLGWYDLPEEQLCERIRRVCTDVGPRRYCLLISEEVPANWRRSIPAVLDTLADLKNNQEDNP
jgi:hypothetical protein